MFWTTNLIVVRTPSSTIVSHQWPSGGLIKAKLSLEVKKDIGNSDGRRMIRPRFELGISSDNQLRYRANNASFLRVVIDDFVWKELQCVAYVVFAMTCYHYICIIGTEPVD